LFEAANTEEKMPPPASIEAAVAASVERNCLLVRFTVMSFLLSSGLSDLL
jgi:hypothetical protein